jgi:hypothetical protein
LAVILGRTDDPTTATLKDMESGEQSEVGMHDLAEEVDRKLTRTRERDK